MTAHLAEQLGDEEAVSLRALLSADIEDLGTDFGHLGAARPPQGRQDPGPGPRAPGRRPDAYLADRDDVNALPTSPSSTAPRRRVLFATGTAARMYRAEGDFHTPPRRGRGAREAHRVADAIPAGRAVLPAGGHLY